jgi:serine/threonine protein kinase
MADLVGEIIDKYRLVRLIGRGGMGEVYEAKHLLVGRRCALKLLRSDLADSGTVAKRMLREAQAAASIGHPNIVKIYDFGVTRDNRSYIVMELLRGHSLAELMAKGEQLDTNLIVGVMSKTLAALAAAHEKGIVHRDLKPENIFVVRSGPGAEDVRLLDFGSSKVTNVGGDSENLTRIGYVLGTPYYMSPEQAGRTREVDGRTDLWAAGVILYQTLSGKLPFVGKNYNQQIYRITMTEPSPPREHQPDLSRELEAVILKALRKNPDERYQSATKMRKDLSASPRVLAVHDAQTQLFDTAAFKSETPPKSDGEPDPEVFTPADHPSQGSDSEVPVKLADREREPEREIFKRRLTRGPRIGVVGAAVFAGLILAIVLYRASEPEPTARTSPTAGLSPDAAVRTYQAPKPSMVVEPPEPDVDVQPDATVQPDADVQSDATAQSDATVQPDATLECVGIVKSPQPSEIDRTMVVHLSGMPTRNEVWLDGVKERVPLLLLRDGQRHRLMVKAPGFKTFRWSFDAKVRKKTIAVEMKPKRRYGHQTPKPRKRPRPQPGQDLPLGLSTGLLHMPLGGLEPGMRRCARLHGARGILKARILIHGRSGVVIKTTVIGAYSNTHMGGCAAQLISTVLFPRFRQQTQVFVFPFRLD